MTQQGHAALDAAGAPRAGASASEILEALVRIPSPSGQEAAAVAWLAQQARLDGFDARVDDAGNLVLTTGSGPPHLLFVGHIDTIGSQLPVRWDGDTLWGRGTVDAKGCLVAAYCAMRACTGSALRFTFVAAVDEEGQSRGVRGLRTDAPDVIINGEPSGWDGITVGYKGIVRGAFHVTGTPHHGGHPEPSVLDRVVSWWVALQDCLGAGTGFEAVQAHLDTIAHASDAVRERVDGRFQLRLPPSATAATVCAALAKEGARHGVGVEIDEALDAAQADPRSTLCAAFRTAIRAAGGTPRILHKTGTSDFNHLAVRYPGVPIIAFGPGDSRLDHTAEEHIEMEHVERSVGVWRRAIEQLAVHDEGMSTGIGRGSHP